MKILYFTRNYNSHDHRFLKGLSQSEHQIYYLTLEQGSRSLEDRAVPSGVEMLSWSRPLAQAGLRDAPWLLAELRRLLKQVKPDLVLAGPIQRCALLTALAGFRPLVSMSWGYDLLIDARRSPEWRQATRFALQRSAAMVCDCDTTRQLAVAHGMAAERIVAFPWGIDLAHFTPAAQPASRPQPDAQPGSERPFTLLSTRSWEPIYGVDTIARAFVLAAQQCPELRLVMLGGGSQAGLLRQVLSKVGGEAGERVLFPGQVAYTDLPRFYRMADLYVAATHSDGTSISLLEAMGCGLPALVSDIPGNREWIEPGRNGWLFPENDAAAMARAILQAVENRRQLPEMGQAARQVVEQRADWNQNFPKLFDAFEIALRK